MRESYFRFTRRLTLNAYSEFEIELNTREHSDLLCYSLPPVASAVRDEELFRVQEPSRVSLHGIEPSCRLKWDQTAVAAKPCCLEPVQRSVNSKQQLA
jgi:hypothetical protein